jgi:hypothetical protein
MLAAGVTFATAWGSGIVSCKRLAPPRLNTTMQVDGPASGCLRAEPRKVYQPLHLHTSQAPLFFCYTRSIPLHGRLQRSLCASLPSEATQRSSSKPPPNEPRPRQGIFSSLWTVGSGVGSILGGEAMQRYGAPRMFGIFAGIMLGGWAAAWLLDGAASLLGRMWHGGCQQAAGPMGVEGASS